MGITNLHLEHISGSPKSAQSSIVIQEGKSYDSNPTNWRVVFNTQYGWDAQGSIDISVQPYLIPRYGSTYNKAYDPDTYSVRAEGYYWRNFTESEWNAAGGTVSGSDARGYEWKIPITAIVSEGDYYGENVMSFFGSPSDLTSPFRYKDRVCDAMSFEINVATNYYNDLERTELVHSDAVTVKPHLDFAPNYVLDEHATYGPWVHFTDTGLWIPYTCNYWARANDRFAVDEDIYVGDKLIVRKSKLVYGSVDFYGRLHIPTEKLNAIPVTGTRITAGKIRFNPIYRNPGDDFATMDLAGAYVYTDTQCNTPTAEGYVVYDKHYNPFVSLMLGDSGDNNSPIVEYEVRLDTDDYMDGIDRYRGKSIDCNFYEPPWDVRLVYKIIGFDANGSVSEPVYVKLDPIKSTDMMGIYRFRNAENPEEMLLLRYNVQDSETRNPIYEKMKLAGREFESVYFGQGQTGGNRISGVVVLDASKIFNNHEPIVTASNIEEGVYKVLIGHPCLLRYASGDRAYVAVTDISVTVPRTMPEAASVSISCTRVS